MADKRGLAFSSPSGEIQKIVENCLPYFAYVNTDTDMRMGMMVMVLVTAWQKVLFLILVVLMGFWGAAAGGGGAEEGSAINILKVSIHHETFEGIRGT